MRRLYGKDVPRGVFRLRGLRSLAGRSELSPAADSPAAFKQEFLRKIDIFRDLSHAEIEQIDRQTRMTTVRRGQVIYRQEDTAEGLFLLKRGRVRLSRLSPSGKKLEVAVLEPGTFFGEMPLLGVKMRSASAEAVDDSLLCVMSEADVERLVLTKPRVGLRMIEVLGHRLAAAEAKVEEFAYRSAASRTSQIPSACIAKPRPRYWTSSRPPDSSPLDAGAFRCWMRTGCAAGARCDAGSGTGGGRARLHEMRRKGRGDGDRVRAAGSSRAAVASE